jgi:hypothetical protein
MSYAELSKPLYHGSNVIVSEIDLSQSIPRKDFGRGFYTTNDSLQAEKFAKLKAKRVRAGKGFVSIFNLRNIEGLAIREFAHPDEPWFDFILKNRGYGHLAASVPEETYDIIIGPVANDAVGLVLNQFIAGTYGAPETTIAKETAIRLLLTQKLRNQVFFGTERATSRLQYSESYDVCAE